MNPIIAEIWRGTMVESRHRGACVVSDHHGNHIFASGDIASPVYPRSAVKAFQCVPVIESGAADHFNLTEEEIALCCASHDGEPEHVRVASSMLQKIGLPEAAYECGAHLPSGKSAAHELIQQGHAPRSIHNNCSGKHAGMLALARQLRADSTGYVKKDHPVQKAIATTIATLCDADVESAPVAIDGCSVPTWALPLRSVAKGFARLTHHNAGQRIIAAVRNHPLMVGGSTSFDTRLMTELPRLFIKVGAEGVYCGCIPHASLGFALKCDDGNVRAAEVAIASMLSILTCWTSAEVAILKSFSKREMKNWRGITVGAVKGTTG